MEVNLGGSRCEDSVYLFAPQARGDLARWGPK
jgi:hypothetical protein